MSGGGDLSGEDWKLYSQIGKNKRTNNRVTSANILKENNISFDVHNNGAHLIVRHEGFIVDFWPGTGKYIVRGSNTYKRGVYRLLKDIGAKLE